MTAPTAREPYRFAALSKARAMVRSEIQKFADDVLAPAVGQAVGEMMREGETRCSALEAKIAALQSAMQEFSFNRRRNLGRERQASRTPTSKFLRMAPLTSPRISRHTREKLAIEAGVDLAKFNEAAKPYEDAPAVAQEVLGERRRSDARSSM